MKKTLVKVSLPFSEVCHKLNYELCWGSLKTEIVYHDLMNPHTDLFLLENNRIIYLDKLGEATLIQIIEPEKGRLSADLSELFLHHLTGL